VQNPLTSDATLPRHLSGVRATGLVSNEPIAQYELGNYRNFVYLILDWELRKAALVDPQADLTAPLAQLRENRFELSAVLITHTHHDHVAGIPELARRFPDLRYHVHRQDAHRLSHWPDLSDRIVEAQENSPIQIGNLSIQALHTPGHSAGECSYLFESGRAYLLTGDTIFIRDCGRTDLESGSNAQMFATIQRIKALSPGTIFLPGHHYVPECATTLAAELASSPPFKCRTVEELAALP
jgi:hydroxyacylglutathione hydrolase